VIPKPGQGAPGVQLGHRVEAGGEILGGRPIPRLDLSSENAILFTYVMWLFGRSSRWRVSGWEGRGQRLDSASEFWQVAVYGGLQDRVICVEVGDRGEQAGQLVITARVRSSRGDLP
jgi:hypothetical protein